MVYLFLILSSVTGIILELVWIRKISFLFGNFHFSSAIIFAALFVGYAAGSYFGPKNLNDGKTALKRFGILNVITLVGTITAYLLLNYTPFFSFFYNLLFFKTPFLFRIFQFIVVCILLFPWAFCYGSAFPLISATFLQGNRSKRYLFNYMLFSICGLAGLVTGAFLILPRLGLTATFIIACVIYAFLGIMSIITSRKSYQTVIEKSADIQKTQPDFPNEILTVLSAVAGFCSMSFELIILRSINLVDNNSFYSFSITLAAILFSFTSGTFLVAVLSKFTFWNKKWVLPIFFAGLMVSFTAVPIVFVAATEGILPLQDSVSWAGYLLNIIRVMAFIVLIPGIISGTLMPLLLYQANETNYSIGTLLAYNTLGVTGAIFFVEIPVLSFWKCLWLAAILCGLSAVLLYIKTSGKKQAYVSLSMILFVVVLFFIVDVPVVWKNVTLRNMKVVEQQFGGGVATLVADSKTAHILVNNQYSIGSNQNVYEKEMQSLLPIALHNAPKKICFVGMGTGITAGAALRADPVSIVVCEISSGVEKLARRYFVDYVNGLFNDRRVKVFNEDGRAYLTHTKETYDIVISELFIPWQSGTASLYTKEFYEAVNKRLENNGIFVQWLPFYQLTMDDFGIIVATLNKVFGQVTMWRSDYNVKSPVIALICSKEKSVFVSDNVINNEVLKRLRLDVSTNGENQSVMTRNLLQYYCGNISENEELFNKYPINTDDMLPIEYTSPKTHILYSRSDKMLTDSQYTSLCEILLKKTPPRDDPFLKNSSDDLGLVDIGLQQIEYTVRK